MSPSSRNPRDATIQFRDSRRWGRCRGSLRGRPHGRHVHRPSLDRWLALTGISFGSVLVCPPFRGPGGPLRGYGLVRSRCPDQLLASCPRSCRPRGCGLVWSRRPDQLLAGCPRSCRPRGCGLVRSRCPDRLLASCPRSRGLRGYDLVRSRRPEHGVEHAEQLPGHRHDGPLLTAAMHQPSEQGSPFRAACRPAARRPPPVPTATVPSLPW